MSVTQWQWFLLLGSSRLFAFPPVMLRCFTHT